MDASAIAPQLYSILNASRETLTQLYLPRSAFGDSERSHGLWSLRFPNLRLLRLDYLWYNITSEDSERFDFFVAHADTIKQISVGSLPPVDNLKIAFTEQKADPQRPLGFSYLAFPSDPFMVLLARFLPRYTNGLERLELIDSPYSSPDSCTRDLDDIRERWFGTSGGFNRLFNDKEYAESIRRQGPTYRDADIGQPFPNIRELHLPIWGAHHTLAQWMEPEYTPDYLTDYIHQCARLFGPTVVVFAGCTPPIQGLTPEVLGEALNRFPNLEQISICDLAIQEGGFDQPIVAAAEAYALKVASTCSALKRVDIKDSKNDISSGLMLEIEREAGKPGGLSQPRIVDRTWVKDFWEFDFWK